MYPTSIKHGAVYEVCTNLENGDVWGYDWHGDVMAHLDVSTGEMTEYRMPLVNNESRRTVLDTSTNPTSVYFFSMMGKSIVRLQVPEEDE